MLGDVRQRCAGLRLVLHSAAAGEARGEDEDGKSRSDQQMGKAAVRRVHASLRGQKRMLNQPRLAFSGEEIRFGMQKNRKEVTEGRGSRR